MESPKLSFKYNGLPKSEYAVRPMYGVLIFSVMLMLGVGYWYTFR